MFLLLAHFRFFIKLITQTSKVVLDLDGALSLETPSFIDAFQTFQ